MWRAPRGLGGLLPNPRMQPTGRGGPAFLFGVTLLEAEQRKRRFVRAAR
jgi:hypothetical protein